MQRVRDTITRTLANIEVHLMHIENFREKTAVLEAELAAVSEEYIRKLGVLNNEARTLDRRIRFLRSNLIPFSLRPEPSVVLPAAPDSAPIETQAITEYLRDPRYERKLDLANHLLWFIDSVDSSQHSIIIRINGMINDDSRDVGEMLEIVPRGSPIWALQADGETLEEQLARLQEWQRDLEGRVDFWQQAVERLQTNDNYGLLLEKRSRNPADWFAYLDTLAQLQAQENVRKRDVIVVLEQEYEARHA